MPRGEYLPSAPAHTDDSLQLPVQGRAVRYRLHYLNEFTALGAFLDCA